MIVCPMYLKSAISEDRDKILGTVIIANDGEPTSDTVHNYNVQILSRNGLVFRTGKILGWSRESKSPMQLLTEALRVAGY